MKKKLADIFQPSTRHTIYVVLAFASAATGLVVSALSDGFQADDIPTILSGLAYAGGFTLAAANTPVSDD